MKARIENSLFIYRTDRERHARTSDLLSGRRPSGVRSAEHSHLRTRVHHGRPPCELEQRRYNSSAAAAAAALSLRVRNYNTGRNGRSVRYARIDTSECGIDASGMPMSNYRLSCRKKAAFEHVQGELPEMTFLSFSRAQGRWDYARGFYANYYAY